MATTGRGFVGSAHHPVSQPMTINRARPEPPRSSAPVRQTNCSFVHPPRFQRLVGCSLVLLGLALRTLHAEPAAAGRLLFEPLQQVQFQARGVLGDRIKSNEDQWLLRAPSANPGMLGMFRVRDRQPTPDLVPWAGEFAGKYLLSAIQALRLEPDPQRQAALRATITQVISELVTSQAEDGYLGPFPKAARLKGNWDLWGHYHGMEALLMWHETTGDAASLKACERAADLICATYLDTPQRVFDAGSHEMNMAVIHGLGWLYRITHQEKYLRMMREIERDWERAGDYLRSGLDGREFYQSPRPRWESLHDLQGLVELYRITGDAKYRNAFEHHWRSILRWDRRNTGGFSSGEQATGDPYAPSAIETCCTVAWMTISLDMLKLTGDPRVVDELELATYNAAAGAQHPSGRWWTYNTPMDGAREASAHTIVFQSRAGTPELNCCSVNGPRSLGMFADWAFMSSTNALIVNSYEPGELNATLPDGNRVRFRSQGAYPRDGVVNLTAETDAPKGLSLQLRVPAWSIRTSINVNRIALTGLRPGTYASVTSWKKGDVIALSFDMDLRFVPGAHEAEGKVSVYRGPLLLAWDQAWNAFDEMAIPALNLADLPRATATLHPPSSGAVPSPWLLVEVPGPGGQALRLVDFASAGAAGTRYRSWLTASVPPPPPVVGKVPADGASIPTGKALFRWNGPRRGHPAVEDYRLIIRADEPGGKVVFDRAGIAENRVVLEGTDAGLLVPDRWYAWEVISRRGAASTTNRVGTARFRVDAQLPPVSNAQEAAFTATLPELLVAARLHGDTAPTAGTLTSATGTTSAPGRDGREGGALGLDGRTGRLIYGMKEFPEEDYSFAVWFQITKLPEGHVGQVVSAWAVSMDDPLRVCVEKGKLFARMEAGQGYSTEGISVNPGSWYHVAAVKEGGELRLYLNGKRRAHTNVPESIRTVAREIGLGGNPHYGGNEFQEMRLADAAFYSRPLSELEIAAMAASQDGR